jgi:hypothetical protein
VSKGRALETAVDLMNLGGSGASGLIDATVGGVLRSDERLDSEGPDSEALDSGGFDSEGFDSERPECECFDSVRLDCGCLGCGSFDIGCFGCECSDCECLDCLRECEFVILLDPWDCDFRCLRDGRGAAEVPSAICPSPTQLSCVALTATTPHGVYQYCTCPCAPTPWAC